MKTLRLCVSARGFPSCITLFACRTHEPTRHLPFTLTLCLLFATASADEVRHRAIELQGLHAYADRESVPAGETIQFHVSSQVPYRFRVTKLGLDVDERSSDIEIFRADKESPSGIQPIRPGSYVRIENGLPAGEEIRHLSVECWVRPWHLQGWQGILTQHNYPDNCGFGLFLDGEGHAVFSIGSGDAYERGTMIIGPKLKQRQWHHLVGTWNSSSRTATLWVDGNQSAEWIAPENSLPRKAGSADLRLGAYADKGVVGHFFEGDISAPVIYKRTLTEEEIVSRHAARDCRHRKPTSLPSPLTGRSTKNAATRSPITRETNATEKSSISAPGWSADRASMPRR